jgi:hypothetical protein
MGNAHPTDGRLVREEPTVDRDKCLKLQIGLVTKITKNIIIILNYPNIILLSHVHLDKTYV